MKNVKKAIDEFKRPINLEQLVADGFLIKKGNTFYSGEKPLAEFPEEAKRKIKMIYPKNNKRLVKVTFYK